MREKEKLLVTSNFSFSHRVFKRLVLQTRKKPGIVWERVEFSLKDRTFDEGVLANIHFLHFSYFHIDKKKIFVVDARNTFKKRLFKTFRLIIFLSLLKHLFSPVRILLLPICTILENKTENPFKCVGWTGILVMIWSFKRKLVEDSYFTGN